MSFILLLLNSVLLCLVTVRESLSGPTVPQLLQCLGVFAREDQQCSLLAVVRYVRVDVDVDTVRTDQLGVHCRGLALHLARVFDHVNLDRQLQPGQQVPQGGQGGVTGVAEELPGFVADVTGLSLLVQTHVNLILNLNHGQHLEPLQHGCVVNLHHRKWVVLLQDQFGTRPVRLFVSDTPLASLTDITKSFCLLLLILMFE